MSPSLDSVIFNSSDSAHSALVRTLEGLALPCQDHFHLICHLSVYRQLRSVACHSCIISVCCNLSTEYHEQ